MNVYTCGCVDVWASEDRSHSSTGVSHRLNRNAPQRNPPQFKEGLISREEALLRINAKAMDFFLHPYVGDIVSAFVRERVSINPSIKRPTDLLHKHFTHAIAPSTLPRPRPSSPRASPPPPAWEPAGLCSAAMRPRRWPRYVASLSLSNCFAFFFCRSTYRTHTHAEAHQHARHALTQRMDHP